MSPQELLSHYDAGRPWPQGCGLDVAQAYQQALAVRHLRLERGEVPRGYKIGFTNRTIWQRYQVFAPIWGTVWDSTLTFCDGQGEISLQGICEPRLESETVFGLRATPPANASLEQLFDSIEWMAPGFEIVQSHMPGWKFTAADTVTDGGLHARLLVGRQVPVRAVAQSAQELEAKFAAASVALLRGEQQVEQGRGSNVLDGPLHALRHFMQELRQCPGAPDLQAGDVITTGTWTDAWPVQPGQTWCAQFDAPLSRLDVAFR